jgi:hypothetical protein
MEMSEPATTKNCWDNGNNSRKATPANSLTNANVAPCKIDLESKNDVR